MAARVVETTARHNERLSRLDPDLGAVAALDLDRARAVWEDGGALATWTRTEIQEGDLISLWGALEQDVLTIRSASPIGGEAFDNLLDHFDRARDQAPRGEDCESLVRLPALEASGALPLLARGFRPSACTAILTRLAPCESGPGVGGARRPLLREARTGDADAITELLMEMHESDIAWGCGRRRPAMREILGGLAAEACRRTGWTWVIEEGDGLVGTASLMSSEEASWATSATSAAPAVYVGFLAVRARDRRHGAGAGLVNRAHAKALEHGAVASILDHTALSPLSSTFWHRRGYRPLWTNWVRPG